MKCKITLYLKISSPISLLCVQILNKNGLTDLEHQWNKYVSLSQLLNIPFEFTPQCRQEGTLWDKNDKALLFTGSLQAFDINIIIHLTAKRASDVMTQTRYTQTNNSEWRMVFLKHFLKQPVFLRWCCLSLVAGIIICILFLDLARFAIALTL